MNSQVGPRSKSKLALHLCAELLEGMDRELISASAAVQRLERIAKLISDEKVLLKARNELDGYKLVAIDRNDATSIAEEMVRRGLLKKEEVDQTATRLVGFFPDYRKVSLAIDVPFANSFESLNLRDPLPVYEELLARIRKDTRTKYVTSLGSGSTAVWSAAELNRLVSGVLRWVYVEATRIAELLEFGQIPVRSMEATFQFVDERLLELVPRAGERLIAAYKNLAETNQENWQNVADTCRRVVKDFADAVFPARKELINGMAVTDDKYLNRVRAFVVETVGSDRQRDQTESVLNLLAELLARTDNLASRSVHSGAVSRFEAERLLIYTYLAIGDILVLSGLSRREDNTTTRTNLNQAGLEELQSNLGMSDTLAAEIVKHRKTQDLQTWDDVASIKGMGPKTLQRIRDKASL